MMQEAKRSIDDGEAFRLADEAYKAGDEREAEFFGRIWVYLLGDELLDEEGEDIPGSSRELAVNGSRQAILSAMYG
jgi:hypothetical protein